MFGDKIYMLVPFEYKHPFATGYPQSAGTDVYNIANGEVDNWGTSTGGGTDEIIIECKYDEGTGGGGVDTLFLGDSSVPYDDTENYYVYKDGVLNYDEWYSEDNDVLVASANFIYRFDTTTFNPKINGLFRLDYSYSPGDVLKFYHANSPTIENQWIFFADKVELPMFDQDYELNLSFNSLPFPSRQLTGGDFPIHNLARENSMFRNWSLSWKGLTEEQASDFDYFLNQFSNSWRPFVMAILEGDHNCICVKAIITSVSRKENKDELWDYTLGIRELRRFKYFNDYEYQEEIGGF